jgi:hypothetical protein
MKRFLLTIVAMLVMVLAANALTDMGPRKKAPRRHAVQQRYRAPRHYRHHRTTHYRKHVAPRYRRPVARRYRRHAPPPRYRRHAAPPRHRARRGTARRWR